MTNQLFEVAGGSVPGREHLFRDTLLIGKNSQDAFGWKILHDGRVTCAVVCDGCGSNAHSEVGAKLGVGLLLATIERRLAAATLPFTLNASFWDGMRQDVLSHLRVLALAMTGQQSFSETVSDYFLFTVVGVILTPETLWTFSVGDGVIIVNGEAKHLGPFPDNAPPYLTYALVESNCSATPEVLRFKVSDQPAAEVQSVLIGSDGVQDLMKVEARQIPGSNELVGPVSQYWLDGKYFKNRDAIRRRLARMNSLTVAPRTPGQFQLISGLLPDDTTLVVVRRK